MPVTEIPVVKVFVDLVIFVLAILPMVIINSLKKANIRSMDCSDGSIFLPEKPESVSDSVLILGNSMGIIVVSFSGYPNLKVVWL